MDNHDKGVKQRKKRNGVASKIKEVEKTNGVVTVVPHQEADHVNNNETGNLIEDEIAKQCLIRDQVGFDLLISMKIWRCLVAFRLPVECSVCRRSF